MSGSLLHGGEHAGGLNNIVSAGLAPRNLRGVHAVVNSYSLAVDDELAVLGFNGAVEMTVNGIILEHVDHVVKIDERIVYRNNLNRGIGSGNTEYQSADTAKAINTDFNHLDYLPIKFFLYFSINCRYGQANFAFIRFFAVYAYQKDKKTAVSGGCCF